MTTKQITATNADDQIKQFYESAFPVEEQIPWDDLVRLIGEMGPGTFTMQDWDDVVSELRQYWTWRKCLIYHRSASVCY